MAEAFDVEAFAWRVEEACANGFPSWREVRLAGWVLRAAGGSVRRVNSVNPLHAAAADPARFVDAARDVYGRLGQSALFRVPDLVAGAAASLDALGFCAEGETLTLMAAPASAPQPGDVSLVRAPEPAWLAAWRTLRPDLDDAAAAAYRQSIEALLIPAAFACRRVQGEPVSVAFAALHRGIAVLESVVTSAEHRGRGHARATLRTLVGWCAAAGAEAVCLQVAADNGPARALYKAIGFDRELYRYRYWRAPAPS